MRALVIILIVGVLPFAAADPSTASDPAGDERTGSTFGFAQAAGMQCHEPSIDTVELTVTRNDQVTTFTWRLLGPIATPVMTCDGRAMPMNHRGYWVSFASAKNLFSWGAGGTGPAPAISCIRASNPSYGSSGCLEGTVSQLADGWTWSMPTTGTLAFPQDQVETYDFRERASAWVGAASSFEFPERQISHFTALDEADARWGP